MMGMTITEKILADHAGVSAVRPGDLVQVRVDAAFTHDVTAPLALETFRRIGIPRVYDRDKVILVADHFVPNKDIQTAQQVKKMREFAREQGLRHFYEGGETGICHVLLPEKGLILPGQVIIGADSHTCTHGALGAFSTGVGSTDLAAVMATGEIWLKVPRTMRFEYTGTLPEWVQGKDLILHTLGRIGVEGALYRAMEFAGPVIAALPMHQRFTMANMAVEGGAKNGIMEVDDITRAWLDERTTGPYRVFRSDPDAGYESVVTVPVDGLTPQVACPSSPANVMPVADVGRVPVDQVFIGSCTNGWLEDLRCAASLLEGRKAAPGLRLVVIPGSPWIYRKALEEGILATLLDAGAVIGPPCCGPCLGGHMGLLAEGERAVSTTNRNFIGRMGHPKSEVYLANPAVAAASAVLGRVAGPAELF